LVFDSLLDSFDDGPITCVGFADDAGLVSSGIDGAIMAENMQKAVAKVERWARVNGLELSSEKSVCVHFTNKYKPLKIPNIKVNGVVLPFSDQVKYLGVLFDKKLTFKNHIMEKIGRIKRLLMKLKASVGKYWGPSPALMRWIMTGIIRPMLSYGSVIWSRVCNQHGVMEKLKKLNRVLFLAMGHIRKSTPTVGMEVIMGLMPLDIYIGKTALDTYARIKQSRVRWDGIGSTSVNGHLRALAREWDEMDIGNDPTDRMFKKRFEDPIYEVNTDSFEKGKDVETGWALYTDGSRQDGKSGYGFVLRDMNVNETIIEGSGHLGTHASVFQAEILGIKEGVEALLERDDWRAPGDLTILSDSQAAIHALENSIVASKTVLGCRETLERASQHFNMTIQ
jgi:hypothetical protein